MAKKRKHINGLAVPGTFYVGLRCSLEERDEIECLAGGKRHVSAWLRRLIGLAPTRGPGRPARPARHSA